MIATARDSELIARAQRPLRPYARSGQREPACAVLAILASTAFTLAYVWISCPLDLAPDEAHYWDWSRHLDWSYYSKGPLVAWLIRASCELVGPLSVELSGNLAAAVRLPALLCHVATMAAWYLLAAGAFRSPPLGLRVILLAVTLPVVRIGATVMTIDPPFMVCWSWMLVCVWRALSLSCPPQDRRKRDSALLCPPTVLCGEMGLRRTGAGKQPPHPDPLHRSGGEGGKSSFSPRPGERRTLAWWFAAAIFCAFGVLAKYTMVLLPAAVMGYLIVHRRREFRRPGIWVLLAGMLIGWLPILNWNAHHDWATFRHVFGQVGTGHGSGVRWFGPVNFLGGQFGMMFGLWLVAFVAAAWRFRPNREPDPAVRLLWWCSVPVWLLFPVASLLKSGQPNWPAPAYIAGFVLAVAWLRERVAGPSGRHIARVFGVNVALGLLVVVGVHFPAPFQPLLAHIVGPPTARDPAPIRKLDITARLLGWKTLAGEVDRLRERLMREEGREPVIAGTYWTIPGHLAFSCSGHPTVFAVGIPNHSDRHSQYDFWRPNPVEDAQAFRGQTFVIVGAIGPELLAAFDRVEQPAQVTHCENGIPMEVWAVWVCHGFHGFAVESEHEPGY